MAIDFTRGFHPAEDPDVEMDTDARPGMHSGSDDESDSDDGASVASDTDEDLEEIQNDDFPAYFDERDGRLFHSHGGCPYPLPVDAEEQRRQNGLHNLLQQVLGVPAVGPLQQVLAPTLGEQRRVLDLATGTGKWVLDMAHAFPHARVHGLDIVPIMTRRPPPNVTFEMHDIKDSLRFDEASIDLVHARSIALGIRDYSAILPEVARVLRPRGLFVSAEWARFPEHTTGAPLSRVAPRVDAFLHATNMCLVRRGVLPIAGEVDEFLAHTGAFEDMRTVQMRVPIGEWQASPAQKALGREFRELAQLYARGMHPMLKDEHGRAHADDLVDGCVAELGMVPGLVWAYHAVHARRRA